MSAQIEFLKRCKALGLHNSNLPAWLDEIESLRTQVAELKAENKRLKTVPMKYRRMEFNAQLQKENADLQFRNDRLVQNYAEVTEEKDTLRRIHAENIEILTRLGNGNVSEGIRKALKSAEVK